MQNLLNCQWCCRNFQQKCLRNLRRRVWRRRGLCRRSRPDRRNPASGSACFIGLFACFELPSYRLGLAACFVVRFVICPAPWPPWTTQTSHHDHYAQVRKSPNPLNYCRCDLSLALPLEIIFLRLGLCCAGQCPSAKLFISIIIYASDMEIRWLLRHYYCRHYSIHHMSHAYTLLAATSHVGCQNNLRLSRRSD